MKTIKEWLKEGLTKEDFKKAKKYSNNLNYNEVNFEESMKGAFIWKDTDEGHDYWAKIAFKKVKQKDSIVDSIVDEFKNRSEVGFKKYGTTLDREDLTELEWRIHFREELMDAILYNEKLIKELKNKS